MPTNHEAVAAYPAAPAQAVKQLARDMSFRRMAYVVATEAEAADLVAVDPISGAAILVLVLNGRVYNYSATSVAPHDGVTVLVTQGGRRYLLAAGSEVLCYAVLDILSAQPASPAVGDSYLLGNSPTGAQWAGHPNQIAIFTSRGWEFIIPELGRLIYVRAQDTYWHKNSGGVIVTGVGNATAAANSIPPSAIIGRPVRWIVENQTTNAPPGSPTVGQAYIIGPVPSGSWAGAPSQIAICEFAGLFTIYAPRVGEVAFDKALFKEVRWNGTVWSPSGDGCVLVQTQQAAGLSGNVDIIFGGSVDDFDSYELRISNMKVSATCNVLLLFGTGAGPTFQTNNYLYETQSQGNQFAASDVAQQNLFSVKTSAASTAGIFISDPTANFQFANGAGHNFGSVIRFDNPEIAGDFFTVEGHSRYVRPSDGTVMKTSFAGSATTAAGPYTAIRIRASAGNITAGRFSLYGYRKQ